MIRQVYLLILCTLLASASVSHAQNALLPIIPAEPDLEEPEAMVGELVLVEDTADQVLVLLEQMTDKIILRRQDLPASKFTFNSRGALTKREAVLALESLLTLNGIMLTDMGGRFMKAVPATNVNSQVPMMLPGSTLGLDSSQQIYAKLFKLDYLNAAEGAEPLVQSLVSQNSSIIRFPKSNALLVTDALINLQRIETILNEADRPQSIREEIKFIKLDFVQAAEMQQRLENLIQGPLSSYLQGNTSVTADERSNQLILITHPGNIDIIMEVVESVDVDAAPLTSSEVFQLRQAKAEEVVPIIEDIISGQKEGREKDAEITRENNERNAATSNNATQDNAPNTAAPEVVVNAPVLSPGFIEASSSLQFSNFVGLSADERTNSIVAYGTQQDLKTLRDLIEKIDIPLPQVRIEAIITEVTLNENQSSGINALGFSVGADGDVSFGGTIQTGIGEGGNAVNSLGGVIGQGFNLTGLTNPSESANETAFTALLTASNGDGNVRVLSTPSIVISHNEEGVINVSESRPIITGSSSTLNDNSSTNVRSNVEFRDIGIQLTVTPLIGADGSVQMKIEQVVDNIAGETTIDGNQQPIIGRREANSTITVNDREIIILGGLQENRRSENNSYFPFLQGVPLLNKFLGGESTNYNRTELVIFIRPTVLKTPSDAQHMTETKLGSIEEEKAVRKYVETNSLDRTYMEGSKLEKAPEDKSEAVDSKPFIKINWP